MTIEQTVIIPSSPVDLAAIKCYLDTGSDSLTRIAGEREAIKEIIDEVAEKFGLPKKIVRKLINVHYKANLNEINAETEDLVELYSAVTGIEVE
jgi:hypothetical protein